MSVLVYSFDEMEFDPSDIYPSGRPVRIGNVGTYHVDADDTIARWKENLAVLCRPDPEALQTPRVALRNVIDKSRLSLRTIASVLGVTQTEVARIRDGKREPRADVTRRIYDLETVTLSLLRIARGNTMRVRNALLTTAHNRPESAVSVILREHNVPLAMLYATEVFFPRTEWATVTEGSVYLDGSTEAGDSDG